MASSWKTFKFQEMACAYKMDFDCEPHVSHRTHYSLYSGIVSIGDGFAERTAVMELRDIFPMCTCKLLLASCIVHLPTLIRQGCAVYDPAEYLYVEGRDPSNSC